MSFRSFVDEVTPAGGGVGVAGRAGAAALGGIFGGLSGVLAFLGGMVTVAAEEVAARA